MAAGIDLVWLPSLSDSSAKKVDAPLRSVEDDEIANIKVEAQRALLGALSCSTGRGATVANATTGPVQPSTRRGTSQNIIEKEPSTNPCAGSTTQERPVFANCVQDGSAVLETIPPPQCLHSSTESSILAQAHHHSVPQASESVYMLPRQRLISPDDNIDVQERAKNSIRALAVDGTNTATDGPYSQSTPVPGTRPRKNIYYDAPVSNQQWSHDDFIDRCDLIVPELKKAIDSHRGLHHRSGDFRFMLRMVGTSPETATPSIIITCLNQDLKALRKLFGKKNAARLYCHVDSKLCSLFEDLRVITRRGETTPPLPTPRPPFTLVFYPTDHPQLLRFSGDEGIRAFAASETTLCGALVQYGTKTASIGLSLSIEAEVGLLTVDHLFTEAPTTYGESEGSNLAQAVESDQITLNDDDYISLNQLWIVDDDDNDLPSSDLHRNTTSDTVITQSNPADEGVDKFYQHSPYCGKREHGSIQLSVNEPYLDVAIVKLDSEIMFSRRVNTIYPGGRSSPSITLTKIAERPRQHGVRVFMISGASGLTRGRLLKGFNYTCSKPGQQMCKTWTAILDSPLGVIPGDCGSIIVDQETYEVYGHVVGADVVGHAHVVPLVNSIQQIKTMFDTNNVGLPTVAVDGDRTTSVSPMGLLQEQRAMQQAYSQDTGREATADSSSTCGSGVGQTTRPAHSRHGRDHFHDHTRERPKKDITTTPVETSVVEARSKFMAFVKDNLHTSWVLPNSEPPDPEPRQFFDYDILQKYLNPERIRKLLETMYRCDDVSRQSFARKLPHDMATDVYTKYLRILAILLMIGQPEAIGNFLNHQLSDEDLPLVEVPPPLSKQSSVGGSSPIEAFSREQWKFCPVSFDPGDFHRALHPQAVLPFSSGETIAASNGTVVHKVTIDAAYSPLHRREGTADHETSGHSSHTVVLKTFSEADEDLYQQEVEAYKSLSGSAVVGVVRCLGSFQQNGRFTILLEHIDKDLCDFFEHIPPPTGHREVVSFWKDLFRLLDGLQTIHRSKEDVFYNRSFLGAHRDIKPANILVVVDTLDETEGKFDFKLASFSCSFADSRLRDTRPLPSTSIVRSAQESYHRSDVLEMQQTDIWSLGCVFSEALQWVILGNNNHNSAPGETALCLGSKFPRNTDASARSWLADLADLANKTPPDDYVTRELLPVVEAMLDTDPGRRPNAHQVSKAALEALHNAEKRHRLSMPPGSPELPFAAVDRQTRKTGCERYCRKQWLREDKGGSNLHSVIEERDQVFLIDDSLTMKKHWDDIKAIFETLRHSTKDIDCDGIDLRFTSPEQVLEKGRDPNQGGRRTALAAVSEVLEGWIDDVPRGGLEQRRSLTVIVLTDGVWGSSVAEETRFYDAIDSLQQLDQPPDPVCVQFIRFGDDEKGKRHLDELCNRLPGEQTPDFQLSPSPDLGFPASLDHPRHSRPNVCSITVQPWNGDIYKMLLPWGMTSQSSTSWLYSRFRIGWNMKWRRWRRNVARFSHLSCFDVS